MINMSALLWYGILQDNLEHFILKEKEFLGLKSLWKPIISQYFPTFNSLNSVSKLNN